MTRRILSAFLALILCFGLVLSVSAEGTEFIVSELGYLAQEEVSSLNAQASAIYDKTGVGIFYAYVHGDSAEEYDISTIVGSLTDYVVMVETEGLWFMHKAGRGEVITFEDEDAIRAIYDETATYVEGVAVYLKACAKYFPEAPASVQVPGVTEASAWEGNAQFLYDDADLLTQDQEAALVQKLEDVSHTYNTQLVIATVPEVDSGDVSDFTKYLYESMDIGYGETRDGVLLLICMDPRAYRIFSNGHAGVAIGPDQVDKLCDFMDTYLPNGHYVAAFHSFADQCGEMLAYYQAGSPFPVGKNLAISLVIGVIAGLIVAFVLKAQLKSVHRQDTAQVYVRQGSMYVDRKSDIYLYRTVVRTKKQEREETTSSSDSEDTAQTMGGGTF